MFRNLADYSISFFSPLRVFNSITFCGVLALVGAFVVAVWLMPRVIAFLTRTHATENLSKESVLIERQHASKAGTPTMGGLVIVASLLAAALLFCDLRSPLVWIGLLVFAGNGFIGFIDDLVKLKGWEKHGLNKRQKTAGLLLVAILAAYLFAGEAGVNTTKILLPIAKWKLVQPDMGIFYYAYFVFVIYACTNAVNLTDGLDGLASGCAITVTCAFAMFAYVAGDAEICEYLRIPWVDGCGELCVLALALIGAVMGFLWFNAHPARIFMGDTGSLAIGGLIGYTALVCKQALALIIAGGVFVLEALSVIIQVISFRCWGKRVFLCAPLHHHLELSGWKENHIVVRLWMLGALLAAVALGTLKLH